MAADPVDLVTRAFDAFHPPDLDALLPLLHPEIELRSLMTEAERTHYRGEQGVREWVGAVLGVFPDWRPELTSASELSDGAVLARFHVTATGTASGVMVDQDYWLAARVRDDLIRWFGFYRTKAEARAALA